MHRSAFVRALAAGPAIAALAAPAAGAQERGGEQTVRGRELATGSLTLTWRGDPARGCAEAGVCDVAGALTLRPIGEPILSESTGDAGGRFALFGLSFELGSGVARVLRGPADDPAGACVEPLGFSFARLEPEPLPDRRVRLTLDPVGGASPSGRCAGPLRADVMPAMPSVVVAQRDAARERLELDLSGRRPFAGGAFSGEVVSTLRFVRTSQTVRGDLPRGGAEVRSSDGPPPRERALLELEYRLTGAAGALTSAFAGAVEPFCVPLDACGLSGSHTVDRVVAPRRARVSLIATGPARALRGGRGLRAALRAVRAGRLHVDDTFMHPPLRGTVTSTAGWDAAAQCREERTVDLPSLAFRRTGGAFAVSLGGETEGFSSQPLFETRCPGPRDAAGGVLATGTIAPGRLGARALTVRLRAPGSASGPYRIAGSGQLSLALRRTRARVRVVEGR